MHLLLQVYWKACWLLSKPRCTSRVSGLLYRWPPIVHRGRKYNEAPEIDLSRGLVGKPVLQEASLSPEAASESWRSRQSCRRRGTLKWSPQPPFSAPPRSARLYLLEATLEPESAGRQEASASASCSDTDAGQEGECPAATEWV